MQYDAIKKMQLQPFERFHSKESGEKTYGKH
jgi:hypothetical protein